MARLIKAEAGMKHSVIYTDELGKHFRYSGGTWTWRNNNPGNVWSGNISKKHGQIGTVFNFAVFPDKASGHLALLDVLQITYADFSIDQMMEKYAPPHENDTKKYQRFLHKATGVDDDRPIKAFTSEQFEKLWRAIEQFEGFVIGKIEPVYKITAVRQEHGCVCDYYVDEQGWIVKEQCIALAKQSKVELEVCTSRLGHAYLRSAPRSDFQPTLKSLVEKSLRR